MRTIAQDKQGAVWFGTAGNGLACLQNQDVRQFKKTDGLSSDFIECLHFDEDGTLWIGTFGGGLNRFKNGRFSVINRNQGLPNSVIGDIESDGRGFFWMSSYGGIIRVSEAELNRCADGQIKEVHCLTYGINDGLPTLECSEGLQPAGCKTADGRLWFPTSKGLVSVDPANVKTNSLPPPVVIEEMRVDDKLFAKGTIRRRPVENSAGPAPLRFPIHRLEFYRAGKSAVQMPPERIRQRLGGRRQTNVWPVTITSRPEIIPFKSIACNNDGVWNGTRREN